MSTNVDVSVTDLVAIVESLTEVIEPIDAPKLVRELDSQLQSLVLRHELETR